ncbi:serine hydrolase domain-containing protein [Flagellimonas sediminis]|uniref:Serine hydrolase n=1 Tax=Flagellimonas sediminis TaxID=2696468 RepID=A0A6I5KR38_9FLAO|nr:serine hydrolase domain-containing protein [Allomuricauda sediminis]NDV42913.1 serine hydrolase [Allomuricauda sediminis]
MKTVLLQMTLALVSCTSVLGQVGLSDAKIKLLDSIVGQDVPDNAPGIATAIIQNGRVIYEKYAGFADLEVKSPINNATRFNIASNGKQFTALAILSLVNDKKLKLSDDLRIYFPELYSALKDEITIRNLLNHTSGIRDCYDLWSLQGYTWWEKSFNNEDVLRLIQDQSELNFRPGTKYLYSNTNYILLALIVEKITNRSFTDYTNEMFNKLNMPNTSFENNHTKIRGQIARAYFNFGTWSTYDWIWEVCGDGNIFSSLKDQINWEQLIQGMGSTKIDRDIIIQGQKPIDLSNFPNYGYGLEFGSYKGLDYSFHEGATGAWKATVLRFPQQNISFLTLTNSGKTIPSSQTRQMVDLILDLDQDKSNYNTTPVGIGKYVSEDEILGTYLTENDFSFTFEKRDKRVFLKRVGRNDVELVREADNIFRQKFDPAFKQEFTFNPDGRLMVTAYYTDHAPYSLIKTNSIQKGYDFKKINGQYFSHETKTLITISHREDNVYEVIFRPDYKTSGLLVSKDKMLVDFYSLEFMDNDIFLNGDRIKKVRYTRI